MIERLPFYMVYQQGMDVKEMSPSKGLNEMNSSIWDVRYRNEENMTHHDYDYMKSAYPDTAKRIMPYVEEECDRLEYSGSMMFDEYPDHNQIRRQVLRVEERLKQNDGMIERDTKEQMRLRDLIEMLFYQEMHRRRRRRRRFKRHFIY